MKRRKNHTREKNRKRKKNMWNQQSCQRRNIQLQVKNKLKQKLNEPKKRLVLPQLKKLYLERRKRKQARQWSKKSEKKDLGRLLQF
nr:uncharacterized protein LOC105088365 isoform X2 [Camelus dromedarius]XP_031312106.1 uncharacterized protein LOC105088365 isoform X2 [Camelus dromedarius]